MSSRVVGLDVGPWQKLNFTMFQVARWGEEEIREFGKRWHSDRSASVTKRSKKQLDAEVDNFISAILGNPPLREIASNPLMLTILAALHHANATLPRRRVDLYAKIVEVMLETWEKSKREARPGDPLHGIVLESREFGWLLSRLALAMQREGRVLRPRWWVNEFVQQFLRTEMMLGEQVQDQCERVVRYLCERTNLFVERGDGVFGFWHRTFQEYFAARGLLLEADGGGDIIALLRPYLLDPQWDEVVMHVAASLTAPRATALLRVVLDDPDPAGRFLRRGQRLALHCLLDGAAIADRALLEQIFSNGKAIGATRWLGISIGFIKLLKRLEVAKHQAEAQRMLCDIENAATSELPEGDFLTVYLSSHDFPDGLSDVAPGQIVRKKLGGRSVDLISPAWEKRVENPKAWYNIVLKSVRNSKTELRRRLVLISFLGAESGKNPKARRALKELLARDEKPVIRAECAEALEDAAAADSTVANLLLERLAKDGSDDVRARCAESLSDVAPDLSEARIRLEELLNDGPTTVRAGAARGLSRLDFGLDIYRLLLKKFLAIIGAPSEPSPVRCASIWAIASMLGRDDVPAVNGAIEVCLDDQDPHVRHAALHVLADAVSEGRREWSQTLVQKIKTMLLGVSDPCPHLFWDLMALVANAGNRPEEQLARLLGDALTPIAERVKIAFVYGSVARREQIRDSDVDLMVIGDARLKDVAAALHSTEQTLGRTINPVLFSAEKFREQYREGNPFLLDVVRKVKIFLKGSRDELAELVADRELEHPSADRRRSA